MRASAPSPLPQSLPTVRCSESACCHPCGIAIIEPFPPFSRVRQDARWSILPTGERYRLACTNAVSTWKRRTKPERVPWWRAYQLSATAISRLLTVTFTRCLKRVTIQILSAHTGNDRGSHSPALVHPYKRDAQPRRTTTGYS